MIVAEFIADFTMIRPKNLPLQTQIAFIRRKMARQGLK